MAYTKEQLLEMYRKLPKDLQDAIFSVDTAEAIRQIGEKNKLMIDKIGELADEVGLVMLGLTEPSQFISHLAERLGVSRELSCSIAQEINAKVFLAIRESLKKIHGVAEEETKPKPETPAPGIEITPPPPATPRVAEPAPPAPMVPEKLPIKSPSSPIFPSAPTPGVGATPTEATPGVAESPAVAGIFEAKTKEEIFRLPAQVFEKPINPTEKFMQPKVEAKKIDPYREPPQ